MNVPKIFSEQESLLEQFVIASDTDKLASACDLLFINGTDLTWGKQRFGLFLLKVDADTNFDEVIEVVEARSKLSFSAVLDPVFRQLDPRFVDMLANVAPELQKQTDPTEREKIVGRSVATEFADAKTRAEFEKMAPEVFGLDQWMSLTDLIASSLLRGAISLRARQLASTGKSEEHYDRMLYALERLNLCDRIMQIAYPPDSLDLEVSIASQGQFRAIAPVDGANVVEWMRLKTNLASLKIGQEKALPLFIANYINRHYPGPPQAFACAKYGDESAPDLDVVIPALELGFEIKLYQAPFSQTDNKLMAMAHALKKQLPSYAKAGCMQVCYVCNLSQEDAETVLKLAQEAAPEQIRVIPIGEGISSLLPLLKEVLQQLEASRQAIFEHKVQKKISVDAKKRKVKR